MCGFGIVESGLVSGSYSGGGASDINTLKNQIYITLSSYLTENSPWLDSVPPPGTQYM